MDDFIKEPHTMEFVDSDHILNYLQNTMEETCKSSLMQSEGTIAENLETDDAMSARLNEAEGILDNLIKTVCDGIDESTLVDKNDSIKEPIPVRGKMSSGANVKEKIEQKDKILKTYKKKTDKPGKSGQTKLASKNIPGKSGQTKPASKNIRKAKVKKSSVTITEDGKKKSCITITEDGKKKSGVTITEDGKKESCVTITEDGKKQEAATVMEIDNKDKTTKNAALLSEGEKSKEKEVYVIEKDSDEIMVDSIEVNQDCEEIEEVQNLLISDNCSQANSKNKKLNRSSTPVTNKETSDHAFQINDNMKKGLSKLAFPSKSSSRTPIRNKKLPLLRPITNTRITIGEALEKAQDAQKSLEEKANAPNNQKTVKSESKGKDHPPGSSNMFMKIGSFEPGESLQALVSFGDHAKPKKENVSKKSARISSDGESPGASEKKLVKELQGDDRNIISPPLLFIEDQGEDGKSGLANAKASDDIQGKGKARTKASTRSKLSSRMWELLKFTFDHEHFPSSVHMARLAKMMGVTWSQVRNWFTNRRVENKRACIFPRDKVLYYCPYCKVSLKTEAEQKGHLFASQHIKKVLGTEFVSHGEMEPVKWKHLPQGVTAVSKSGGTVLAVGCTHNAKDMHSIEGEEAESVTKKLDERWKDSFLFNDESTSMVETTTELSLYSGDQLVKNFNIGKNFRSDCGDNSKIKEEVIEESSVTASSQEVKSVNVKTEVEDNLESIINKVENINSEQLLWCSNVVASGAPADGGISNKYMQSSQEGKYGFSKVLGISQTKGKKKPYVMDSEWISKGLRRRQKKDENYIEDCVVGYQCPTCFKIFQTEWQMIKHSMIHLLFMCGICENAFPSEHLLKLHLHDHLTGAYEEEKYYCQFSCKSCHSLKCECSEYLYIQPRELPKNYQRPQRAIRSKKTFITKPYSGPNDHLRVTVGNYQKLLQRAHDEKEKKFGNEAKVIASSKSTPVSLPLLAVQGTSIKVEDKEPLNVSTKTDEGETQKLVLDDKGEEVPQTSSQPRLSIRKDLILEKSEDVKIQVGTQVSGNSNTLPGVSSIKQNSIVNQFTSPASIVKKEIEPPRKGRGRPTGRKKTTNDSKYTDGDFYYMCEICDSSFFSKADMQEHMFFHRLKSRSRRGEKRGCSETFEGTIKKQRAEIGGQAETVNVVGFERFKCPQCKSHFANVTDLNRHKTQAHNDELSTECLEVLKCNYCEKTYRRERELRRHLKHACSNAPSHLKSVLSIGTTLQTLQERGDGPHFSVVSKSLESLLTEGCAPTPPVAKGPYKCRYCPLITRREQEMKRHIWKYCSHTPRIIKRRCKEGASLEDLGFSCRDDEVEDLMLSGLETSREANDEKATSPASSSSASSISPLYPHVAVSGTSAIANSKEPLVCAYCGIWYYREISLVKHMKERCIIIPDHDKELLRNGANLCDTLSDTVNPKVLKSAKGIYKKVKNTDCKESLTIMSVCESSSSNENKTGLNNTLESNNSERTKLSNIESTSSGNTESINPKCMEGKTPSQAAEQDKFSGDATTKKSGAGQNKRNNNKKSTRCSRCHDSFISADAVLAHSSIHHGPKKGFYKCKLCFERFQRYKQLREHVWEHTQETPYKCHICDAKFRLSDSIMDHLPSIHGYTAIHEKNLFKWLPTKNGKYRVLEKTIETTKYECEESLEGMDTNLENLAEDMVITDDIWTLKNKTSSSLLENIDCINKNQSCADNKSSLKVKERQDNSDKITSEESSQKVPGKSKDRNEMKMKLNERKTKESEINKRILLKEDSIETKEQSKNVNSNVANIKKSVKEECLEDKNSGGVENVSRRKGASSAKMKVDSKSSDDDDDDVIFSGIGNLESIIETVNLTDESFLE